MLCLPKQTIHS